MENRSKEFNEAFLKIVPKTPTVGDKQIFAHYDPDGPSRWRNNWLRAFDFSGVAWDSTRAGTLIGQRHIIMAKHYQRPKGSQITFHNRDGLPVTRTILDVESSLITDITVGLLDAYPDGCAIYPTLAPGQWHNLLSGCHAFVLDQERKALIYSINQLGEACSIRGSSPEISSVFRESLISGDSGHPAFLPYGNGGLVLLTTHWYGGAGTAGPGLSSERIATSVREAAERVSARNQ